MSRQMPKFDEPVVMERDVIRDCFQFALEEGGLVEVSLDGAAKTYSAILTGVPGDEEAGADYVRLSPLEPAAGNALIRRSRKVQLTFGMGEVIIGSTMSFVKSVAVEGHPQIELSFPPLLKVSGRRQAQRTFAPEHLQVSLIAARRGRAEVKGRLLEINTKGLSFRCPVQKPPLDRLDRIKVEIAAQEADALLERFVIYGEIINSRKYRIESDSTNPQDHLEERYGVMIGDLNGKQTTLVNGLMRVISEGVGGGSGEEEAPEEEAPAEEASDEDNELAKWMGLQEEE